MIAEEFNNTHEPDSSIPKGTTINYILKTIKESSADFKLALKNPKLVKPLNENKLTQILVAQINAILKGNDVPILAQEQYNDVFLGSKGVPDFYFQKVEKGQFHEPLFVVEAKVLPAPLPKTREKEYVIGDKNNGGIERFKTEKHGKGLLECGIIGFIEDKDHTHWIKTINDWITTLSTASIEWKSDEILKLSEAKTEFAYLNSIAYTSSSSVVTLHHFWI